MTRRQKIIVVSIASFLVLVLGVFVFLLLTRETTPPQEDTTDDFIIDDTFEEEVPTTSVTPIKETANPVSVFTYRDNALYYVDTSGALWKKSGGEPQRIGEFIIQDPNAIFSSPDSIWLLVGEGAVSTQKKFTLINTRDNTTLALPQGVREARFMNNAELIYYKESLATTGIFIYDSVKKKERLITSLNPIDIRIRLINPNLLLVSEKPTNGLTNLVFTLNLQTKELEDYFSNFSGSSLSPIGNNRVLAFLQNPQDEDLNRLYNLVLLDQTGRVTNTLNITTMPEKCMANGAGTHLYCAVPQEWSKNMPGLDLPDDYYKQGTDFTEKIYRIDLVTFVADEITTNAAIQDAIYLSVNEDSSKLYYQNRKDGYIYSLQLPTPQQ